MCDAACRKIIINSGFMAALASLLSQKMSAPEDVRAAAHDLHIAAETFTRMVTAAGIHAHVDNDWEGCGEAQKLLTWLSGDSSNSAAVMRGWTTLTWASIADLAAGKLPG